MNQLEEESMILVGAMIQHSKKASEQSVPDLIKRLEWLLESVGHKDAVVVPGRITGNYLDQGGGATGETYIVNYHLPYKVLIHGVEDSYVTGWLDNFYRFVLSFDSFKPDLTDLAKTVAARVSESIPHEPIKLTVYGDRLIEPPPRPTGLLNNHYLNPRRRDSDAIGCSPLGVHDHCAGWIDWVSISAEHRALFCRKCFLRVSFPATVVTYGDLRQALSRAIGT